MWDDLIPKFRIRTPPLLEDGRAPTDDAFVFSRLATSLVKVADPSVKRGYQTIPKTGYIFASRRRPAKCEACGETSRTTKYLCFDHDHSRHRFRGWLCSRCNTALGLCDDSPKKLRRLALYQERYIERKDRMLTIVNGLLSLPT